jgi:GxxExxY protein
MSNTVGSTKWMWFTKGATIEGQRVDVLIENQVVVEIKLVSRSPDFATSQFLSCLRSTGLKRALLKHFAEKLLVGSASRISL